MRKQPYYTDAIKLMKSYTPLQEALGDPIKCRSVARGIGSKTRVTADSVSLQVPVHGPKDSGILLVEARKNDDRQVFTDC